MRALVVGAGAVGQVYGRLLQRGGAEVGVYVKERYAQACRDGFTLRRVRWMGARAPEVFRPDVVVTRPDEVAGQGPWDQVWLCMSSPALAAWADAPAVFAAAGPRSTVVCLQPGLEDADRVTAWLGGRDRLVEGVITLVSWHAPLPGAGGPGGGGAPDAVCVAYFLPPGGAPPFAGPPARVQGVIAALRAGGHGGRRVKSVRPAAAFGSATLLPLMAALEAAGWSFAALRSGGWLAEGAAAAREAHAIVTARLNLTARPVLPGLVARPPLLAVVTRVAAALAPFPLEGVLRAHFVKVGDQTRQALAHYRSLARDRDLPAAALARLAAALDSLDAAAGPGA